LRIYVEYEAELLAALGLATDASCDGVILQYGAPEQVLASTCRANILADDWLVDAESPGDVIVSWSGTLAGGLFESHPMTWLRPGREAFAEFCRRIGPQLERHGKSMCFHPHSRHVLSDAASCVQFAREQPERGGPFSCALAPADLFEPGMLADMDNHLTRMFEMLGGLVTMVILRDVAIAPGERCEARPLGRGVLPRELVRALLRDHVPEQAPVVLGAAELEGQLRWLGL